jgi:transposase-like protein
MNKRRQREREEHWQGVVGQQEKSGKSVRAFCLQQGINEHSFYMWRQRLKQKMPVTFALVESVPVAKPAAALELILTGGERLRIPAEAEILRTVLAALRPPA